MRRSSWKGFPGHEHARPATTEMTRAFNARIEAIEDEKQRKRDEQAAKRRKGGA